MARNWSLSPATVSDLLGRAQVAGLCWPLPGELNETALEAQLYPQRSSPEKRPLSDWPPAHRKHLEWTRERIVAWGQKLGPATIVLVQAFSIFIKP